MLDAVERHERDRLARLLAGFDGEVGPLVQDLGGHDLAEVLLDAARRARRLDAADGVFAYTIKGYGLPIAGRPQNHSALLSGEQIDALRLVARPHLDDEWDRFDGGTPEADACEEASERLERQPPPASVPVEVADHARRSQRDADVDAGALGRILLDLSRVPGLAERLVTVSPDVSASTNLGGWINKVGVWSALGSRRSTSPNPAHYAGRSPRRVATSSSASRR